MVISHDDQDDIRKIPNPSLKVENQSHSDRLRPGYLSGAKERIAPHTISGLSLVLSRNTPANATYRDPFPFPSPNTDTAVQIESPEYTMPFDRSCTYAHAI